MICVFDSPIHPNGGCIFADPSAPIAIIPRVPDRPGRGSGPTTGIRPESFKEHREDALRETRLKRILAEDEDIVALIMAMLKNGLM